ncbi:MAG: hypothetical protein RI563_09110 [Thiohalophilus sp.]|uniref:hypothetical protein n=1 Tax=Thiohalophilus sp. TaxID=3028392 RepID=UPI0028707D9F|nr:hypothetical protein [Thiohalophilus sp.]MDR9437030.1 hypothetical protein [Thiohalophilus sp.]
MKIQNRIGALLIVVLTSTWTVSVAQEGRIEMPPKFSLNEEPEKVLSMYPLSDIDKNTAFAHHGKADNELTLPNGKEGWLYDVGKKEWHRTYTLVFGSDGVVIDVLYYDHGHFSKHGLTALQVQTNQIRTKSPALGPGPGGKQ